MTLAQQIEQARDRFLETGNNDDALKLVSGYIKRRDFSLWFNGKVEDVLTTPRPTRINTEE